MTYSPLAVAVAVETTLVPAVAVVVVPKFSM
jgi:hypothetical protein